MSGAPGRSRDRAGQAPLPNLAGAPWLARATLHRVVAALAGEGGRTRVVGGAVRDALIGRPVSEVDLATTVLPDDIMRLAGAARLKAVATGIEHGTVTVIADHEPYEVTTLRRDVETDGRRAVVAFTTDWTEDARRRDFTVNALYAALDGAVHDPVGGYEDLRRCRVRFIGDAETRIREDYLRILRLFRFHAEIGIGEIDGEALAAAVAMRDGLAGLSRERVRHEMLRLLGARGALAAVRVMAANAITDAIGLEAPDVGRLERLEVIEDRADPLLALAALARIEGEGGGVAALAGRLRLANDEKRRLEALAPWREVSPDMSMTARRELVYRAGARAARDRVAIAWAASGAAPGDAGWGELAAFAREWSAPRFPVKGGDLAAIGMARGPALGAMLRRLEGVWLEQGCEPGREELIAAARALAGDGARQEG